MNLVTLQQSTFLRRAYRGCKLHHVSNWMLGMFPYIRKHNSIVTRAKRTEHVSLGMEIFDGNNYPLDLLPDNLQSVADIGCNVGYFTCMLASKYGKNLRGIMVDANPHVLKEARWHRDENELHGIEIIEGIVGSKSNEFYVFEADTCSASRLGEQQAADLKRFTKTQCRVIDFESESRSVWTNTRCDVLKVDIEGAELDFLRSCPTFLRLVDNAFIEWHEQYEVSLQDVNTLMESAGLMYVKTISKTGTNGTAFYKRKSK